MIRVAQAGSDERYTFNGGAAGDQRKGKPDANGCFTGELNISAWYNKPWDWLIRANDEKVAETMAKAAELICKNVNVGYDQSQDETMWEAIEKLGWKLESINKVPKCETDCCRMCDVEVRLCGITNIPNLKHKWTGNIREALVKSGHFTAYNDKTMTQTTQYLKRGDLLLQEGHHIVTVLDTYKASGEPYIIKNCIACHLRADGSTKGKHICYMHNGDIVMVHGWSPSGWGKVETEDRKVGYISPKYLVKIKGVQATEKLWLRAGAGTTNNGLVVIPKGTKLSWKGQSAMVGKTRWLALEYGGYSGFSSTVYLKFLT